MNRFFVRQFLNRRGQHGGAYLLAQVEQTTPAHDPDHDADIWLEIADCRRSVSFDFPMWTARHRSNSVRKARMLADVLARFADAVEAEAELSAQRARRRRRSRARENPFLG